ncbi:D-alanine--D-alanine ligase [Gordoniibacillus kamchatkensis]|uniref:D-alanine--D-alanine ligase n=1 Tax=Gordoniibacillus kamchatkensis TaxID=1590651 RepID=A0ABR5AMC3_9BACL|nr:D-alanine--D-alanine ligase [Paenibacillus sp. VKM B-2647]KIL42144.1 D-alanine--D-alanine ligase [Paenibacillus sp. VKM B-2647]
MKVGVIMGGVSSEREVSLKTGRQMIDQLDRNKYEPVPIVLTKREDLVGMTEGIDIALLALHGAYGEDGTVQGTLETLGIPYTGSGVLSSGLCMDKDLSKRLLLAEGIPTPDWFCWTGMDEYAPEDVEKRLGFPVFVKPNRGGSSIGAQMAADRQSLRSAVREALRWDRSIIVEQYMKGDELTCSILNGELLPIVGIRPVQSGWFDYQAKYAEGAADEQVIVLPAELEARVRETALACYRLLKCSVYARIDMMLVDGIPYVLEANTLPGMTVTSLLPKSAEAAGISFDRLLNLIIELSMQERKKEREMTCYAQ